jgi:thioredoxin 1
MQEIQNATEFQQHVLQSSLPVLVDFSATWCGPCRMLAPVVEEFSKEQTGTWNVYKVDIDKTPDIADQYGIQAVPTLVVFQQGKIAAQRSGAMAKNALNKWVEKAIATKEVRS